jgi:hypothetical protein
MDKNGRSLSHGRVCGRFGGVGAGVDKVGGY